MSGLDEKPENALLHVHVCIHCGSSFRREDFEGRALSSGIFPCRNCGVDGPLNIEVRDIEALS